MKKISIFLTLLLLPSLLFASPPSSSYTYTAGQTIQPSEVQQNETNIYNYLSTGVDTYADSSIVNADISGSAAITYGKLSLGSSILTGDIKDGEIVNADISSSAAIALSKLATTPMIYADTRFKVGSFTRDISLASGTQAVTSVGFQPKAIIFFASMDSIEESHGFDDSATATGNVWESNQWNDTASSIYLWVSAGNAYSGKISSFDSDGFTITWTKIGEPTGTATIKYLAFR